MLVGRITIILSFTLNHCRRLSALCYIVSYWQFLVQAALCHKIILHLHPSPQMFILTPPIPAIDSSHHRRYIRQSTFNEYVSLIIPEYRSWCIILHCCRTAMGVQKKCTADSTGISQGLKYVPSPRDSHGIGGIPALLCLCSCLFHSCLC